RSEQRAGRARRVAIDVCATGAARGLRDRKIYFYLSIFAVVLVLLFLPALFGTTTPQRITILYWETLLLAATFLALGLASGCFAHDRAQALIVGISAWLLLLFGFDLVALFAARWQFVQKI